MGTKVVIEGQEFLFDVPRRTEAEFIAEKWAEPSVLIAYWDREFGATQATLGLVESRQLNLSGRIVQSPFTSTYALGAARDKLNGDGKKVVWHFRLAATTESFSDIPDGYQVRFGQIRYGENIINPQAVPLRVSRNDGVHEISIEDPGTNFIRGGDDTRVLWEKHGSVFLTRRPIFRSDCSPSLKASGLLGGDK